MSARLDRWDRQIVAILQQDGRTSNVDIARQLGLSEATVRKRLDKLVTSNVIRIVAVPEPGVVGLDARMVIAMQADLAQIESIACALAAIPQVCSVNIVTGTYDVVIEVVLPATGHLLSFLLDRIVTIPGVKRTDTFHVLKSIKRPSEWVIPEEPAAMSSPQTRRPPAALVPGAIVVPPS